VKGEERRAGTVETLIERTGKEKEENYIAIAIAIAIASKKRSSAATSANPKFVRFSPFAFLRSAFLLSFWENYPKKTPSLFINYN
jgi:hypothetical protein